MDVHRADEETQQEDKAVRASEITRLIEEAGFKYNEKKDRFERRGLEYADGRYVIEHFSPGLIEDVAHALKVAKLKSDIEHTKKNT